jgi:integral membrane protein
MEHAASPAVLSEPVTLVRRAISRLRVVAFLEGVSYLILLGIAVPLKYLAGMPQVVSAVGLAHGLLFLAFIAAVVHAAMLSRWRAGRVVYALAASVVPFGTFVLDRRLRDEQQALEAR